MQSGWSQESLFWGWAREQREEWLQRERHRLNLFKCGLCSPYPLTSLAMDGNKPLGPRAHTLPFGGRVMSEHNRLEKWEPLFSLFRGGVGVRWTKACIRALLPLPLWFLLLLASTGNLFTLWDRHRLPSPGQDPSVDYLALHWPSPFWDEKGTEQSLEGQELTLLFILTSSDQMALKV